MPGDPDGAVMIQVYPDLESLSRAAADAFVRRVREVLEVRDRVSLALSGGHTPRRTYELLAQPEFRDEIDWKRVHVFWGDERCVPPEDPRSNARLAREALLDHVPLPAGNVHPIWCGASPEAGAAQYAARLKDFFAGRTPRFDLMLLGLGADGHTASLFPGSEALKERSRWTAVVKVPQEEFCRVTLTFPLINQAALIAVLVAGADKAETLKEVLKGPREPQRLPARLLSPLTGELRWLVDREAAARL
ncbi:MAG: 6-phosphogluconolactonase [Thermodesulfobacteriota bacterium]